MDFIFTKLAHVLGKLALRSLELRYVNRRATPRMSALAQEWNGNVTIHFPADLKNKVVPVRYNFKLHRGLITGESHYTPFVPGEGSGKDEHIGDFHQDKYLLGRFYKIDKAIIGFGAMVLEMNDKATHMHGFAIGYGSEANGMYVCSISVTKGPYLPSISNSPTPSSTIVETETPRLTIDEKTG